MAQSPSETRALKHWIANSIEAQAATILGGTQWTTLVTYAQRPKIQKLGSKAMITVGRVRRETKRVGMGRPAGLKRHEYSVTVYATAVSKDEQAGGDDFDQLFDQMDIALENLTIEATITDPRIPAQQFRVAKIAEEITGELLDPVTTETEGLVSFACSKDFTVWLQYNN